MGQADTGKTVDTRGQSLPQMLQRGCALANARPEPLPAIVFQERTVSFDAFAEASDRVAAGLAAQGVCKGDRIGLYCINSDWFAIAWFGIVKAGATVVPINLLQNPKEILFVVNDAAVSGMIWFEAFADSFNSIRASIDSLRFSIRIGSGDESSPDMSFTGLMSFDGPVPDIEFNPAEDVAAILYTSGTTGRPKGAMLTHANLAFDVMAAATAMTVRPGNEAVLVVLPMFHSFAANVGMLMPLLNAYTQVLLPRFDPEEVARTIEANQVSIFMGVPSMYNVMSRLADEHIDRLRSLRYCISGGAAMPQAVMQQFESRYGVLIYEGDGPTECSPVTSVNPIGGKRKPSSIGVPIPGVEMSIRDHDGHAVANGEIGEICVRGPNIMKGYWQLPDATAESFFGDWFRTGDLGSCDDEGYFSIVDRIKDMVIVNGMNVYPRIVEEVLYAHPAVAEVAVVGEPNDLHGEIPVAYIALREGQEADSATLRAFCRASLGPHEVPRKVFFVDALPKNAAGKIVKRELRKTGELERGIDSRQTPV